MKTKKRKRSTGEILLELEPLLEELTDDHELQWSDTLFLVYGWLMVHRPEAREEYLDGTHPEFFYGKKV